MKFKHLQVPGFLRIMACAGLKQALKELYSLCLGWGKGDKLSFAVVTAVTETALGCLFQLCFLLCS